MKSSARAELAITGIGVVSAVGQGKTAFLSALLQGDHAFRVMLRPGRQNGTAYIGAEIGSLELPADVSPRLLRNASFSGQVALTTLHEAWFDARLESIASHRVGLIIGGSNLQQREQVRLHDAYATRFKYVPPSYGVAFLDTDLCGLCTEQFPIRGFAHTLGAASASGQAAVIAAAQAVAAGDIDVCVAMGALADLSYWECQALRSMGAMGTETYADRPELACRPFDVATDGFIYGEACAAVVVERLDSARKRGVRPYARIAGWATALDGNRSPDPSVEGERKAIENALARAELAATDIDYINPHGTGSALGDKTEVEAIKTSGLEHAYINATKSITGHGLSAAGAVEIAATVLQMRAEALHPTRNLSEPIDPDLNWVREKSQSHVMQRALTLSVGFGGVNTAMCLERADE